MVPAAQRIIKELYTIGHTLTNGVIILCKSFTALAIFDSGSLVRISRWSGINFTILNEDQFLIYKDLSTAK